MTALEQLQQARQAFLLADAAVWAARGVGGMPYPQPRAEGSLRAMAGRRATVPQGGADMNTIIFVVAMLIGVFCILQSIAVLPFYRAFFRATQRFIGKDPDAVIRKEFPWGWWLF